MVDILVLRVAHLANQHGIIPKQMFNADQTPSYFSPAASKTWELKGSRDVQVVSNTAKQSYTAMATSTAAGDFLPIQVCSCLQAPRGLGCPHWAWCGLHVQPMVSTLNNPYNLPTGVGPFSDNLSTRKRSHLELWSWTWKF